MTRMVRLTAAQAMVRWLLVQVTEGDGRLIEGVWAIFGHGNVAGLGEALHGIGTALPTWRGQNEQYGDRLCQDHEASQGDGGDLVERPRCHWSRAPGKSRQRYQTNAALQRAFD